jgi:hypothetical protein
MQDLARLRVQLQIRIGYGMFVFLVRPQKHHVVLHRAFLHHRKRSDNKTIIIDAGINGQRNNQSDVGAFGRFDGADPAVVGGMDVADLEAGPLAVEAARPQGAQTAFVRQR